METYKTSVQTVLSFLKESNYSTSVISLHRLCYQELEDYLTDLHQDYSLKAALDWVETNKNCWSHRGYVGRRHCINQLEDVIQFGHISQGKLFYRKPAYSQLIPQFRMTLDAFCAEKTRGDDRYRVAVSRFLLFLQNNGLAALTGLDYELIIKFHKEDFHNSAKTKNVYEDLIRVFLRYLAEKEICPFGLSLALNVLLIKQIVRIPSDELIQDEEHYPAVEWATIIGFLSEMKATGYSKPVLNVSKHLLTLLYIFLDMHHVALSDRILWIWYEKVVTLTGTNWKQQRRTLCQFIRYLQTSMICTDTIIDPRRKLAIDKLPGWSRTILQEYLQLLKREGWQPSTIDMHRSSNCRFCNYLAKIGLISFSELTSVVLRDFNLQDKHSTPEGKTAYNCRIRSFIQYLYEQKLINDPFLYKVLPTCNAPRTSLVETLTEKDIASIWAVDPKMLTPIELRDYAIVSIGLTMGFRASDIISLRLDDIDWKERSIHIIQRKTGKALKMPMPIRTGNALFRYLRDGRPQSPSEHVFVRHDTPYDAMTRAVCARALRRFTCRLSRGFHKVRKTFATNLLRGNTAVMLISDTLGHSTDDTVHKYLSLDESRMRLCPLSLLETGLSYNGGAFHA